MPRLRPGGSNVALLALWTLGCARPAPVSPAAVAAGAPGLICPPGTSQAGKPPPAGIEAWCQRLEPDGRTRVRQGPYVSWYRTADGSDEKKSAEGAYVDGRENGQWIYWYENGEPKMRGTYVLGVKDGQWTTFHPNGQPASEGHFVQGVEQGTWQFWDEDATWRSTGEYLIGARDGLWLEYGPGEEPIRERVYRKGQLIVVREL